MHGSLAPLLCCRLLSRLFSIPADASCVPGRAHAASSHRPMILARVARSRSEDDVLQVALEDVHHRKRRDFYRLMALKTEGR